MNNALTLETLYKLRKEILKSDNEMLVSQIDHAIMKTYKDQLVFSFIGHYSAGKSSLINHLLNQDILPSSPVPTTSNTVSVQIGGTEEIQAFVDQYKYIPLESYESLRDLNTKDLDITSISMDVRHPVFKERTVFQDTPGVDSNTDSHQEGADRFLLNSDYIFFTVEYNHVESEHNLKILKDISNLNIPFSLIINQVDKHDDAELSMDSFLSRIRSTLAQWKINPNHILTTTIYESPYNEMNSITELIAAIEDEKEAYKKKYHERIVSNIEDKQTQYLNEQLENIYIDETGASDKTLEEVDKHIKYLDQEIKNNALADLHEDPDILKAHVKERTKDIARNSYLYPHQVKSAITDFLKVLSGDIQATGIFGKKKKQQALYEDHRTKVDEEISPVIKTEIDAPINSLFGDLGMTGEPFRYHWDQTLLYEEDITTLNNTYVLNYLDKLKKTLETDITNQAEKHLSVLDSGNIDSMITSGDHQTERDNHLEIHALLKLKDSIDTMNYRHFYIHMDDEVDKLNLQKPIQFNFEDSEKIEHVLHDAEDETTDEEAIDLTPYRRLYRMLETHPRHERFKKVLGDKLDRIDNGLVNISVFGGFSAGKTTFINALMGESKLKTSPNPTTAAITEINRNEESAAIYKREDDLAGILKVITNQDGDTVQEYMPWLKKHRNTVREQYMPFVNGIFHKYDEYKEHLGKEKVLPTDELIFKISSDQDAIFIHKALLSIKNELTEKFTIVDSPGINSTNQRHTKETHNIIANSDLIIYVSYYNHVFSRSDENFLKYIQSIKGRDQPIIFIINAVDLMKSEADREKVIDYMDASLKSLDIKNVIYPLSSKRALEHGDEGFNSAKDGIVSLAEKNASKIQYDSLKETGAQFKSALESNIRRYSNQQAEMERINQTRTSLIEHLYNFNAADIVPQLDQEIDIVYTHMDRQLELKLYDHLKGLINVSNISDRKFLSKNEALLTSNINSFLTIETATSFNAVYRLADGALEQMIRQFNEKLLEANTASQLDHPDAPEEQVNVSIDPSVLANSQKPLYQAKNSTREFRNQLLKLAGELVKSIDHGTLKSSVEEMVRTYMQQKDDRMAEDKDALIHSLREPLPEISEDDYREDKSLLGEISSKKEVSV